MRADGLAVECIDKNAPKRMAGLVWRAFFEFRIYNLFRISIFGFRIYLMVEVNELADGEDRVVT